MHSGDVSLPTITQPAPQPSLPITRSPSMSLSMPVSVLMVCASILSVQFGAAVASLLFDRVGAAGTVFLRQAISAAVLLCVARPKLLGRTRADWLVTAAFGAVLATMNLCFYEAVGRLPLGIAVTIELLGPLGLAVALSRRLLELSWVGLALTGVLLLGEGGGDIDLAGVAFALGAASCWAGYILLSASAGRRSSGIDGLALAMGVGAVLTAPFGVASGGSALLSPGAMSIGAGVALLSSVVPFTLELTALRRMPPRTFGVLMSLSPAAASSAGFLLLDQTLGVAQVTAIGCVIAASAGCVTSARCRHDPSG